MSSVLVAKLFADTAEETDSVDQGCKEYSQDRGVELENQVDPVRW